LDFAEAYPTPFERSTVRTGQKIHAPQAPANELASILHTTRETADTVSIEV